MTISLAFSTDRPVSLTVIRGEYIYGNPVDLPLLSIEEPSIRERIKVMSDRDMGGFSEAHFDIIEKHPTAADAKEVSPPSVTAADKLPASTEDDDSSSPSIYGLFHGNISLELPRN